MQHNCSHQAFIMCEASLGSSLIFQQPGFHFVRPMVISSIRFIEKDKPEIADLSLYQAHFIHTTNA